jgi:WD40 repeat protein
VVIKKEREPMKSTQFSILTVLVIFSLFSLNVFAQDYTQFSLPEGAKARLGKGWISGDIAYSPDGTRLAVASSIGIWLYDTATHQEVALLKGHTDSVESVAFSPDGDTLASGGFRQVRLWDAKTGQPKATLRRHTGYVYSVAFSPDGGTIASGSESGTIILW